MVVVVSLLVSLDECPDFLVLHDRLSMVAYPLVVPCRTATARNTVRVSLVPVQHRCMIDFSLSILKGYSISEEGTLDPIRTMNVLMECTTIADKSYGFHGVFSLALRARLTCFGYCVTSAMELNMNCFCASTIAQHTRCT